MNPALAFSPPVVGASLPSRISPLESSSAASLRLCDVVQFHSPISGGIRRYIEDKARSFARLEGIEHTVLIPGPTTDQWTNGRTRWVQLASPMMPGSKSYRLLVNGLALRQALRACAPDVIEVADPYQTAWTALRWARGEGARIVLYYHSDYPRAWHRTVGKFAGRPVARLVQGAVGAYLSRLLRRVDAVFVASRKFERFWSGVPGVAVHRVPMGFDAETFFPRREGEAVRARLGLCPDDRLILFAGRLAPEKRLGDLLEAFAWGRGRGVKAHLAIVGDGELAAPLRARAAELEIAPHWIPFVESRAELAAHYTAADLLVHPGSHETFGLSVLESAACGTPALVVRNSGLGEAARAHPRSRLVDTRQASALGRAIGEQLSRPVKWSERWPVHQAIAGKLATRVTSRRQLELYRALAAGPGIRRAGAHPR